MFSSSSHFASPSPDDVPGSPFRSVRNRKCSPPLINYKPFFHRKLAERKSQVVRVSRGTIIQHPSIAVPFECSRESPMKHLLSRNGPMTHMEQIWRTEGQNLSSLGENQDANTYAPVLVMDRNLKYSERRCRQHPRSNPPVR